MYIYIIEIHKPRFFSKLPALKKTLEGHEWKVEKVEILYNPSCTVPNKIYPRKCPFEVRMLLNGVDKVLIKIFNICVGNEDQGSQDVANILDFLGVKYSHDDIFTKSRQNESGYIHLEYTIK